METSVTRIQLWNFIEKWSENVIADTLSCITAKVHTNSSIPNNCNKKTNTILNIKKTN